MEGLHRRQRQDTRHGPDDRRPEGGDSQSAAASLGGRRSRAPESALPQRAFDHGTGAELATPPRHQAASKPQDAVEAVARWARISNLVATLASRPNVIGRVEPRCQPPH